MALVRPLSRPDPGLLSLDRAGDTWIAFGFFGPGWRAMTLYGTSGVSEEGRAVSTPLPTWISVRCAGPPEQRAITTLGAGWPMIALSARRTGIGHDEPRPGTNAWHTGLGPQWVEWRGWEGALAADGDETATDAGARLLPIGVYPAGLVIDVLAWSAIWSMLPLSLAARRARRRRRGACVRCGYDLRGSGSGDCPECGMRHALR